MTHCIIAGVTRCGTTSLYNYLAAHPAVAMAKGEGGKGPGRREVHFFDYEHHYEKGIEWYRRQFKAARVTLETSPTMLQHRLAPERLREHIPDCRLIVLMREPGARAYSDYWLARKKGWTGETFEHDLRTECRRIGWEQETPGFWENCFYLSETHLCGFLERGRYAEQLRRWLKCFPEEHMLLLKSELFFHNPGVTVLTAWHWLGLPTAPLPKFRRWQQQNYDPMDAQTRRWLDAYYREPNQELKELVGWTWTY